MFTQVLIISSLSRKFSKGANTFEIIIWYYSQTPASFSFLRFKLSRSNICAACLLTDSFSLTFPITRQWPVARSAPLRGRASNTLKCYLLSINPWSVRLWVQWNTLCNFFVIRTVWIVRIMSLMCSIKRHTKERFQNWEAIEFYKSDLNLREIEAQNKRKAFKILKKNYTIQYATTKQYQM